MSTLEQVIAEHYPSGYVCGCGRDLVSLEQWGEHVAGAVRMWFSREMSAKEEHFELADFVSLFRRRSERLTPVRVSAPSWRNKHQQRLQDDGICSTLVPHDDHETVDGRCPGRGPANV